MPEPNSQRPVVIVPACNRTLGEHPFHIAGHKYVDAVRLAGAIPLVVPGLAEDDAEALLDLADGVLLTGSPSNVHPSHFGEAVYDTRLPLDPARDGWVLPFVRRVLARGLPLLAICRGTQETNVALGGSLHQAVHEVPGLRDHRADGALSAELQYAPAHRVQVRPGGVLEQLLGGLREFEVNSLHGQAVAIPAPGLRIEAVAPDGVVEAFSVADAPGFNLCLQWHPEWQAAGNPVSMCLLQGFGAATRQYRDRVRGPLPTRSSRT